MAGQDICVVHGQRCIESVLRVGLHYGVCWHSEIRHWRCSPVAQELHQPRYPRRDVIGCVGKYTQESKFEDADFVQTVVCYSSVDRW
jgi:hypothetical protein